MADPKSQDASKGDNRSNTDRDGNRAAAKTDGKGSGAGGRNARIASNQKVTDRDQTVTERDRGDGRRTDKKPRRP